MLSLQEMTSGTALRLASGLLLTGLLALGMNRLADGLSGAVDGLLLADACSGTEPSPNHGQNEGGGPPPDPVQPKAVPPTPPVG